MTRKLVWIAANNDFRGIAEVAYFLDNTMSNLPEVDSNGVMNFSIYYNDEPGVPYLVTYGPKPIATGVDDAHYVCYGC
ncbi:MAG: hypothetical protein CV087_07455 [Candidatus Brocadia sp. WS118]|nr:MAG: hypothetical protein CV087_07455 [Candidatus Brocadia sp. WS118]